MRNHALHLLSIGCALALVTGVSSAAPTPAGGQAEVQWEIQVVADGQQIDSFSGTTALGQSDSATHHHPVTHRVGCQLQPAGEIDLERTVTVSPLAIDPDGAVTLAIDTQQTLEDPTPQTTSEGCALPPQPREISAMHPGLVVPAGQWASWQLLKRDPSLAYRVRASAVPPGAQ